MSKYLFIYEPLGNLDTTPNKTTVESSANVPAQQKQLQGYYVTEHTLLQFAVADVAPSTCSGVSTSPKLLITPRKVTEVQSDPANIADLAKWCQSHISRAKVIHM